MWEAAIDVLIWLVGLFHKSSADKLAALRVKSATDDSIIKGLEQKDAINTATNGMSADDIRKRLHDGGFTR